MGDPVSDIHAMSEAGIRRAFLLAIAVFWVFLAVLAGFSVTSGPFLRVAVPALLVALGLLLVGLGARLLPVRVVGPLMLLIVLVTVFTRLLLWRLGILPDVGDLGDAIVLAVYLAISFPVAFLVFGTRRGLRVSVAIYLAFVGLYGQVILAVLLGRTTDPAALVAVSLTMTYAALIATMQVLASRLEQLATQHARADRFVDQATTDALTGIANRRRLDDELGRLIAQSRRHGQPLSVILIDLDLFKQVNDEHGHEIGDQVLIEAVQRLAVTVRDADLLGRWGGEEFLLLAPDTDHAAAKVLAERCRRAIAAAPMPPVGRVTASFGVATHASDDDLRWLIRRADLALYTAKAEGRDRVVGLSDLQARDINPLATDRNGAERDRQH